MGFKLLVFGFVSSLLLIFVGALGVIFGTTFIHRFVRYLSYYYLFIIDQILADLGNFTYTL